MNQKILVSLLLLGTMLGLSGCSIIYNPKPLGSFGAAELVHSTNYTHDLDNLPPPKLVLPVAVYGFKDQTGQYKPQPDSSFSTAVSQGSTAMLIKALKDSGWFATVERENLQDILTERKIVRAIEQPGDKPGTDTKVKLPTLIGAGMVLEGSVIGYDENVKSGGLGVKWLGLSADDQYRADQVTVNLRAVDIGSGLVLESVTTSKTVYSTQLDTGEYRYVNYQSLLEIELGTSLNEPTQIALQEAIEAAVVNLIVEGVADNKWQLRNDSDRESPLFKKYRNAENAHAERVAVAPPHKASPVAVARITPAPAPAQAAGATASAATAQPPVAAAPAPAPAPAASPAPAVTPATVNGVLPNAVPWSAEGEDSVNAEQSGVSGAAKVVPTPAPASPGDTTAPTPAAPVNSTPPADAPAPGTTVPAPTPDGSVPSANSTVPKAPAASSTPSKGAPSASVAPAGSPFSGLFSSLFGR